MGFHDTLTGIDIHVIHAFTYSNAAARTGATGFTSADVGKVALQTDTLALYVLTATTPTWSQLNGGGTGFTAGGDLSGTSTSQNVINIHGASVPIAGSLTTGNTLQVSGSSTLTYTALNLAGGSNFITGILPTGNQAAQSLSGDTTGTTASSTVINIHGASVPIAGSLTTGNVLQVSGSSALSYGPLNLAGGTNFVTGALPSANQAAQVLTGDVTGTTSASTVTKIQGNSVQSATLGASQDGYVAQWVNSAGLIEFKPPTAGGSNATSWQGITLDLGSPTGFFPFGAMPQFDQGTGLWEKITPYFDLENPAETPVIGDILKWDLKDGNRAIGDTGITATSVQALVSAGSFVAGGDLSGTMTSQTVTGLQGVPIATSPSPIDGYVLTFKSVDSKWHAELATGGSGFTAGTDLAGTSTNQTVVHISGTGGKIPFAATIVGASGNPVSFGVLALVMPSDADYTLSSSDMTNRILRITSTPSLTATRNIILPAVSGAIFDVYNATTGSQSLTFKASSGSGITIVNGSKASVYFDGTNYVVSTVVIGGDLTPINNTSQTVAKIQGNAVKSQVLGSAQDGYCLVWTNSANDWEAKPNTSFTSTVFARASLSQVLPAYTFVSNGGPGDTITLNSFAAMPTVDGVTLSIGDSVFFPFGVSYFDSGLYVLNTIGNTSSTSTVLTRSTLLDTTAKLLACDIRISEGNTRRGAIYHYVNNPSPTWGTTALGWMRIDGERTQNEFARTCYEFVEPPLNLTNSVQSNGLFNTYVGTASLAQGTCTATETGLWVLSATSATGACEVIGGAAFVIDQSQYFEMNLRMSGPNALSDGTNTFRFQFGLGTAQGTAQTAGLFLEYNQGSDTHWLVTARAASTSTTIAGATVPASNTTWHKYRLVKYIGETTYTVLEDNVSLGTLSTNLPTGIALAPIINLVKTAGTTARTVVVDTLEIVQASPGRAG